MTHLPQGTGLVWDAKESGMSEDPIRPIDFLTPVRFKLSFNKVGNVTSMPNYAEELDGEWVWLVDACNGSNSKLYTEDTLHRALLAAKSEERGKAIQDFVEFAGRQLELMGLTPSKHEIGKALLVAIIRRWNVRAPHSPSPEQGEQTT